MQASKFYLTKTINPRAYAKVLIIDDNDFYAESIKSDLESRGSTDFTRATTGKEGIDIINQRGDEFDLIMTDISMETEYAGVGVLQHLKKLKLPVDYGVTTTALNSWPGFYLLRLFYIFHLKTSYLIPKRPIRKSGKVLWLKGALS